MLPISYSQELHFGLNAIVDEAFAFFRISMMKTDVIIIGAGPTGLALACQFIRQGVSFVIIDKNESTTPHSKAIGVQARTLEIYEQIGLADKLVDLGWKAERARMIRW